MSSSFAESNRGLGALRWQVSALTVAVQKWSETNSRARCIAQAAVECCRIISFLHSSSSRRHLQVALLPLDSMLAKVSSCFWRNIYITHIYTAAYSFNYTDATQRCVYDMAKGAIVRQDLNLRALQVLAFFAFYSRNWLIYEYCRKS